MMAVECLIFLFFFFLEWTVAEAEGMTVFMGISVEVIKYLAASQTLNNPSAVIRQWILLKHKIYSWSSCSERQGALDSGFCLSL